MKALNSDISGILNKMADLLEIEGANPFRVRAYRNAARTVDSLPKGLAEMAKAGENLDDLSEIGEKMAEKIREIVKTGTLGQLKETEEKTPADLVDLMKIQGLGPKRVGVLYRKLGIGNLKDLKKAAEKGAVLNTRSWKDLKKLLKEDEWPFPEKTHAEPRRRGVFGCVLCLPRVSA